MPRSRPPYPPEFREQMIELVHAGRAPEELAEEFRCSAQSIRNWVAQSAIDSAADPRVASDAARPSAEGRSADEPGDR